ncbi:MAG TPA: response regulator [Blastocatellia bacterium]|nr:response regulator [Blastocatellia bacterium]
MENKILIVEDHPDSRDLLAILLRQRGHTVYTAEDGREGLKFISLDTPDLIITDLNMPNLDGIEMIKILRGQPECQGLPVIVVTAHGGEKRSKAIEAGANEAMDKPIDCEALFRTIDRLLIGGL